MSPKPISQIQDYYIDLSQIKTFRVLKKYSNDKDKRMLEIHLKDRVYFVDGDKENREMIPETIEILFENEREANAAAEALSFDWERYIINNLEK